MASIQKERGKSNRAHVVEAGGGESVKFAWWRTVRRHEKEVNIALLVVLAGLLAYGIGALAVIETKRGPVRIIGVEGTPEAGREKKFNPAGGSSVPSGQGALVGSRHGSIYHLPWCSGAQRIKPENEVWFESAVAAREAGYRAAKNCPGLAE